MAKTLSESAVSTPNARRKLAEGLHWRGIDADVHLGYRKGRRAGRWLVRWYLGDQKYQQETIGAADDALDADGIDCLSFEQAKSTATKLVARRRADILASAAGPAATVQSAVEAYLEIRDAREVVHHGERKRTGDARLRLTRHVLSNVVLAAKALHALSEMDLTTWRDDLPPALATSTVRRIVNDFKAALNAAAVRHRTRLPAEVFVIIKNGLATGEASAPTARDTQALSDADVRRVISAAEQVDEAGGWDGDLLRIVLVLASTGARFSQVRRQAVSDVQAAQGRLMVPTSRKGKGTKKASHIAVRVGADVIATLRPAVAGRRAADTLLERWRHRQISAADGKPPQWVRDVRGPWLNATELTRPWREIVALSGLPADVVPYSLRHSSIVRQLRAALPVRLVAALHDTSTRMIEAHYSAAIVDAMDAVSAGAVIPLIADRSENVVKLHG